MYTHTSVLPSTMSALANSSVRKEMNKVRNDLLQKPWTVSMKAFVLRHVTGAGNPTTAIANIPPHPSSDRADELQRLLSSCGWLHIKNDCPLSLHLVVRRLLVLLRYTSKVAE